MSTKVTAKPTLDKQKQFQLKQNISSLKKKGTGQIRTHELCCPRHIRYIQASSKQNKFPFSAASTIQQRYILLVYKPEKAASFRTIMKPKYLESYNDFSNLSKSNTVKIRSYTMTLVN